MSGKRRSTTPILLSASPPTGALDAIQAPELAAMLKENGAIPAGMKGEVIEAARLTLNE